MLDEKADLMKTIMYLSKTNRDLNKLCNNLVHAKMRQNELMAKERKRMDKIAVANCKIAAAIASLWMR